MIMCKWNKIVRKVTFKENLGKIFHVGNDIIYYIRQLLID